MRQIKLEIDQEAFGKLEAITGREKLFRAIGYLSTWGISYPRVDILCADLNNPEIHSGYYEEDGTFRFLLVAIWDSRTEDFSFHS